jgi:hypothetical protein
LASPLFLAQLTEWTVPSSPCFSRFALPLGPCSILKLNCEHRDFQ